jgi:site-specific recombinase XerD
MAVASVQSDWRILRALWTFLTDDELLSAGQQKFFLRGRIPCPRETDPELRPVCPPETFAALLKACAADDPEEEWRNKAMLSMVRDTGARISELIGPRGLRDQDISLVNSWATVRGKGARRRWVYWTEDTGYALAQYLQHRRGAWGGVLPLFRGMSSRNNGEAFTSDAMRSLLRRLAKRMGVKLVEKAPIQSLRHAFAHDGLDEGIDEFHLQQLLGHQSPTTTARYTREHPRRLRQVYDRYYRRKRRNSGRTSMGR